jgi:hypothetical protein
LQCLPPFVQRIARTESGRVVLKMQLHRAGVEVWRRANAARRDTQLHAARKCQWLRALAACRAAPSALRRLPCGATFRLSGSPLPCVYGHALSRPVTLHLARSASLLAVRMRHWLQWPRASPCVRAQYQTGAPRAAAHARTCLRCCTLCAVPCTPLGTRPRTRTPWSARGF